MVASFITATPPVEEDLRWTSAAVLVAMAARGLGKGSTFTSTQLRAWVPGLREGNRFKRAMATLEANQFVTFRMHTEPGNAQSHAVYTVTPTGAEAIKAAASGVVRKSGPKGPHGKNRVVPPNTFAARLWALMRARQMLDTATAAATLVDAGQDVDTAAKTAQRYLARWASTGALAVSKQRLACGCKRYVLVKDSPTPPAWTDKAKARAAGGTDTPSRK